MYYIIGITLALVFGAFACWVGLDRDRAFYPTVMIVIGLYYVLFAAMGASSDVLLAEVAVCIGFWVAAVAGFKKSLWLVVGALAAHGVFDFVHPHMFTNPGVPAWWPQFCGAYDVAAAIFLGCLIIKRDRVARIRTGSD
jgi:hypothetical protein